MLLEPKIIKIERRDGTTGEFVIHLLPALAGRRILTQYVATLLPKVGDYDQHESMLMELLSYVCVKGADGGLTPLSTPHTINSHCGSWETLVKLEYQMLEYNVGFLKKLGGEDGLTRLKTIAQQLGTTFLQNMKLPL